MSTADENNIDWVQLEVLHNYELFLRIAQRTQQLARLLLNSPELVTRQHLEQWERDAIAVQPALEGCIAKWGAAMASRHTARAAAAPDGQPPRVM